MTALDGGGPLTVAEVRHVSKRFAHSMDRSLRYGMNELGREVMLRRRRGRPPLRADEFWALDDVSLVVRSGESWGVIGANGSGKSTLLRTMHGITKPDAGSVTVRGRHGGLLDLGSVFDPLQTGRENLLANAAVLGMKRDRVLERIDQILEFAGIGDFIDAPVQTYSSGMKTRLAFATVAHLDLDVLLVDETLIAGDLAFRRRCIRYVQEYVRQGGAMVLVDHDLWLVQAVCSRCLVLEHGRVAFSGPSAEAVRFFIDMQTPRAHALVTEPATTTHSERFSITRVSVEAEDAEGIRSNRPVLVQVDYEAAASVGSIRWGFVIMTGDLMITVAAELMDAPAVLPAPGPGRLVARVGHLPLVPGHFSARVVVIDHETEDILATTGWADEPASLRVEAALGEVRAAAYSIVGSIMTMDTTWSSSAVAPELQ